MDTPLAIRLTEILVLTGVLIQAVETLTTYRLYAPGGLYDWSVMSTVNRWTLVGIRGAVLATVLEYRSFMLVVALQFLSALVLVSGAAPQANALLLGIVLAVHMLLLLRNQYGLDGSDQMMLVVLWPLFLYSLHPTETVLNLAFGFICAQLCLSYFTSGGVKLISPIWRQGGAIKSILSTRSYGSARLSAFLLKHKVIAGAACWAVIVYEIVGPLLIWLDPKICIAFIAAGVIFHFSIAFFMGLNIFFWSFISTYPAVYYFASRWSLHVLS